MNIDYEAVRFWLGLIQLVVTGGVWIYVWLSNKHRVNKERLRRLEKVLDERIDDHDSRISAMEAAHKQAPTHGHLAEIHEKVNKVGADVSELKGEMKGIAGSLRLIQEHLLNLSG